MQQRVKSSGANAIPVMRQLLHHRQPKDRLVRGVHKHVDPYKTEKEFSLLFQHTINIPPPAQLSERMYYRISI